jgi:uncharacterized repeat protein (TIGR01451 family)
MNVLSIRRLLPLVMIVLAFAAGLGGAIGTAEAAPGPPDLALAMSAAPTTVQPGGTITYNLTVSNSSVEKCTKAWPEPVCSQHGRAVSGVVVQLSMPSGTTYQSGTGDHGFTCAAGGSTVTCSGGSLAMDDYAAITIKLNATCAAGTKTASTSVDPGNLVAERSETNNSATATVTVAPCADLALSIVDSPDPVGLPGTLTYTDTVTNNGTGTATAVTLTHALPAGVTFGEAVPSQGSCSAANGTVTCNLGNIAAGATVTVRITVMPPAPSTLSSTASVSSAVADPNTGNNTATATTTANWAAQTDLEVTEFRASSNPVARGETMTFTVKITNVGSVAASGGVYLRLTSEQYPPSMVGSFRFGGGGGWTCFDARTDTYNLKVLCAPPGNINGGSIPAGGSITLTITIDAFKWTGDPASTDHSVTARVGVNSMYGPPDGNSSNDAKTMILTVR